ncbi:hypothetical protein BDZ97DRAFT_2079524 [Flammula alnicola]|nr:hypothetical protein BDZ97DRAFT_2079524 [Flammula alnicola]
MEPHPRSSTALGIHPSDFVNFANITDTGWYPSFGLNKEDVIDESYCKAGEVDPTNFVTPFSPLTPGIIDAIHENLRGQNVDNAIEVELDKLNVYGPESSSKAHVDAPCGDAMFGCSWTSYLPPIRPDLSFSATKAKSRLSIPQISSLLDLLICTPLLLHSSATSSTKSPSLPQVIASRSLITCTPQTKLHLHCLLSMLGFKSALAALLADPEFLPMGGFIGFGLSHRYPINPATTELSTLARGLKGSDAVLQRICNDLSLELSLKTSYRPSVTYANLHYLLNSLTNFPELTEFELGEDTDFMHYVKSEYDGVYVYDFADGGPKSASQYVEDEVRDGIPIVWIKPLTDRNNFSTPYTGPLEMKPDCLARMVRFPSSPHWNCPNVMPCNRSCGKYVSFSFRIPIVVFLRLRDS